MAGNPVEPLAFREASGTAIVPRGGEKFHGGFWCNKAKRM